LVRNSLLGTFLFSQDEKHSHSGNQAQDAKKLGNSKAKVWREITEDEGFCRMITPIKFNKIPDYRIINDIEGKNLPIKSFLPQDKK